MLGLLEIHLCVLQEIRPLGAAAQKVQYPTSRPLVNKSVVLLVGPFFGPSFDLQLFM